jgi:hypothetical protein
MRLLPRSARRYWDIEQDHSSCTVTRTRYAQERYCEVRGQGRDGGQFVKQYGPLVHALSQKKIKNLPDKPARNKGPQLIRPLEPALL